LISEIRCAIQAIQSLNLFSLQILPHKKFSKLVSSMANPNSQIFPEVVNLLWQSLHIGFGFGPKFSCIFLSSGRCQNCLFLGLLGTDPPQKLSLLCLQSPGRALGVRYSFLWSCVCASFHWMRSGHGFRNLLLISHGFPDFRAGSSACGTEERGGGDCVQGSLRIRGRLGGALSKECGGRAGFLTCRGAGCLRCAN